MFVIAVDIDGVLAEGPEYGENYHDDYLNKEPMEGAIDAINKLKLEGNYIKLFTARFEEDREVTEQWLNENDFPYDELIMGKPQYDIIIDDRAIWHTNWENTLKQIPGGREK